MKMNLAKVMQGAMIALVMPVAAHAALSQQQRLEDFHQLVSTVERNYAPLRWKKTSIGLDWKANIEKFRDQVIAAKNDVEFYGVLTKFLAALKDGHVSAEVPSTLRARLGFISDYVDGKVLIEEIDTLRLPSELFPFKKGDQLIALGGVPVEKIMSEITQYVDLGNELTMKRYSAVLLTARIQARGMPVPKGVTTVTVLPKGAAKPITVTATWAISGNPIVDLPDLKEVLNSSAMTLADGAALEPQSGEELLKKFRDEISLFKAQAPKATIQTMYQAGIRDMGSPKSMFTLPAHAKKIDGMPVTAAIYEAAGKKIGVLRVPSYTVEEYLGAAAQAILQLEAETDVLVLDQTNNPGGYVHVVSNLVSLFAQDSVKDIDFAVRPSMKWLESFQGANEEIAGMLKKDPKDAAANALAARFQYLESEMRDSLAERRYLSNPFSLNFGGTFGMIQPQPEYKYTKPILLLVNELDISGGDAFPAIMQDAKRAVLFGQRTIGGGGNVAEYGPLTHSHFKFSLTESLMVRANGQYVENLGVTPDIIHDFNEDDFMNGYRNYVKAFSVEALKLVGVSTTPDDLQKEWDAKKTGGSN